MKLYFIFFLIFTQTWLKIVCKILARVPIFDVNLDKKPEERWTKLIEKEKIGLKDLVATIKKTIPDPSLLTTFVTDMIKYLNQKEPEFMKEMNGVATTSGISISDIVIINMQYELISFLKACTSIVAQDASGNIWHGRNLDFGFTSQLRKYTILTWPGYVGALTGQRPNGFSISLNQRDPKRKIDVKNIHVPQSFAIRKALETKTTYQDAVTYLSSVEFMVPSYIIIGGIKPGEGIVLTRDQARTVDSWNLNKGFPQNKPAIGIKAMNSAEQSKIGPEAMIKVLSTKPVFNNLTTFSTVMSAAKPGTMMEYTIDRGTPWNPNMGSNLFPYDTYFVKTTTFILIFVFYRIL